MEESEAHLRLDQLVSVRTGLSRRKAREILKLGGVQVDRKRVRVASKAVAPGTEVRVALDDSLVIPPDLAIPVVFEDRWLLVVNKPAGMPTQGTQASDRHDLLALLARQRPGGAPDPVPSPGPGHEWRAGAGQGSQGGSGPAVPGTDAGEGYLV